MMIFPADLMDAGTFAASAESTVVDGAGFDPLPPLELPPQPASVTASAAAPIRPATARRRLVFNNICNPLN
jgi:hypothetical protein